MNNSVFDNSTLTQDTNSPFSSTCVHLSRTMMYKDLQALLTYVDNRSAELQDYYDAIVVNNCLGKPTEGGRRLTFKHMRSLYSLSDSNLIFHALRHLWDTDIKGRPLLALLCAYSRDTMLRSITPYILEQKPDSVVYRDSVIEYIQTVYPRRYSPVMQTSFACNVNGTFTSSGHLSGHVKKIRCRVQPTTGSITFALLLGYLSGLRGELLFNSEFISLLDCTNNQAFEVAQQATMYDWIRIKRLASVTEVKFSSDLIPPETK